MLIKKKNRIDAVVEKLMKRKRKDLIESKILKFNPDKLKGAERESWYHTYGMVAFQRGERALAFERFQEGAERCPESHVIAFSLGQEYEFRGDTDMMFALFDRALFPNVPGSYALAQSRYAYLWNRYDKALLYLWPVIAKYFELRVLDDTFLFLRGMPMFGQTWSCYAAFQKLHGNTGMIREMLHRIKAGCSEIPSDFFDAQAVYLIEGDPGPLTAHLQSVIAEHVKHNIPWGYAQLMLNILASRRASDPVAAERLLMDLQFGHKDFPWLDDMRLLARCELENRKANQHQELALRQEFVTKQPLLFEPSHALDFSLLNYQETLKAEYQAVRKG